jgi:peroxiredoxin
MKIYPMLFILAAATAMAGDEARQATSEELRLPESWFSQVEDYAWSAEITMGAQGMQMAVNVSCSALRPGYCTATTDFLGMNKHVVCSLDSLWTTSGTSDRYSVEPWSGTGMAEHDSESPFLQMFQPPFPFESPLQLLTLDPDEDIDRFAYCGRDTLETDDGPVICDVWDSIHEEGVDVEARIWLEAASNIRWRLDGRATKPGAQAGTFGFRIKSLKINPGLQPGDFVFRPEPGSKRVSGPGKLMVVDSLEGETPPDFTLRDSNGDAVATGDWRGKVVVIDFWATWCQPCLKAIPDLEQLRRRYGDDVVIVGVSSEQPAKIAKFLAEREIGYPILMDEKGEMAKAYRVSSLPAIYMLDRGGVVREHFVGGQIPDVLGRAVARLLE